MNMKASRPLQQTVKRAARPRAASSQTKRTTQPRQVNNRVALSRHPHRLEFVYHEIICVNPVTSTECNGSRPARCVPLSIRKASFPRVSSYLQGITCRKCVLQFLVQLKVQFPFVPLFERPFYHGVL